MIANRRHARHAEPLSTATAAGRITTRQRWALILSLTATPGGIGYPLTAGFAPACAAIENFSRNLAAELGPYRVCVVNIRSGGSPDRRVFRAAIQRNPGEMEQVMQQYVMNQYDSNMADCLISEFLSKVLSRPDTKGARRGERPRIVEAGCGYLLPPAVVPVFSSSAAWAAARRAVSRRKGEQET